VSRPRFTDPGRILAGTETAGGESCRWPALQARRTSRLPLLENPAAKNASIQATGVAVLGGGGRNTRAAFGSRTGGITELAVAFAAGWPLGSGGSGGLILQADRRGMSGAEVLGARRGATGRFPTRGERAPIAEGGRPARSTRPASARRNARLSLSYLNLWAQPCASNEKSASAKTRSGTACAVKEVSCIPAHPASGQGSHRAGYEHRWGDRKSMRAPPSQGRGRLPPRAFTPALDIRTALPISGACGKGDFDVRFRGRAATAKSSSRPAPFSTQRRRGLGSSSHELVGNQAGLYRQDPARIEPGSWGTCWFAAPRPAQLQRAPLGDAPGAAEAVTAFAAGDAVRPTVVPRATA